MRTPLVVCRDELWEVLATEHDPHARASSCERDVVSFPGDARMDVENGDRATDEELLERTGLRAVPESVEAEPARMQLER